MMLIPCPWCGPRDENEFGYGGDAHVERPINPDATSDDDWAEYLFYHDTTKGVKAERWHHRFGCRRWFNLLRDTANHRIHAAYPMGQTRPDRGRS